MAQVAKDIAVKGLTLADVRAALVDDDGKFDSVDFDEFCAALGMDEKAAKAFEKAATLPQLLALLWHSTVRFYTYDEMDSQLVAVAEAHGLNVEKMMEAQLATAKAEALMGKAS